MALAAQNPQIALVDVPYPGFEGRPRAGDWSTFLDQVESGAIDVLSRYRPDVVRLGYASGIGGLIALSLRERGGLAIPLIFQGPVLWGLEHRLFPKFMRSGAVRAALKRLIAWSPIQRRFVRKHLQRPLEADLFARFFEGYARCAAFDDFFRWMTPALLRELERGFAAHPDRLTGIQMWWGLRDTVVSLKELEQTETALGHRFARQVFPDWGHYPLLDHPEEWARALGHALEQSLADPNHATSTTAADQL